MQTICNTNRVDDEQVVHEKRRFLVAVAKANFDFQGVDVEVAASKPTCRQLLDAMGFRPTKEHLLFRVPDTGALENLRLEEETELGDNGANRFIVFRSDRSFRVEINGRRFEWGASELSGLIAKRLVGETSLATGTWLVEPNRSERFIRDTDLVELTDAGVERLRTGPAYVLEIEGKKFQWPESSITADQIAELGGWPTAIGVQQIDLETQEVRTLELSEAIDLNEDKTFGKKPGWRRG